jgi:arginase
MANIILPVPSSQSIYGLNEAITYKRILNVQAANDTMSEYFPSNLLVSNCQILEPICFKQYPDSEPEKGSFLASNLSVMRNLKERIKNDFNFQDDKLCIIGGDHSISIGTGAGLSELTDMSKIGMIYIDAHSDFNTPQTSLSKCITGYPCAVNAGLGLPEFTNLFNGNFIQKIVQIGIRDVDELEINNLEIKNVKVYSVLDVEELGMKQILKNSLEHLKDCDYIWLSMDIDSLDSVYFKKDETDVPVSAGLTPRELLYIVNTVWNSGKLKIYELTQLNDVGYNTPLVSLSSRLIELSFGLGLYRYGIK